jgi:hypothetical protein
MLMMWDQEWGEITNVQFWFGHHGWSGSESFHARAKIHLGFAIQIWSSRSS